MISSIEGLVAGCRHLQHLLELFGREIVVEEVNGIKVFPIFLDFVMHVRSGRFSGVSDPTYDFTTLHVGTGFHLDPVHMTVQGLVTETVVYNDVIAISVAQVSGRGYPTVSGGKDGRTLGSGEVKACVKLDGFVDRIDALPES